MSFFLQGCSRNESEQTPRLHWDTLACLPDMEGRPNPGVAGAFSGISHHKLLVAGGANFPDKPAWENGIKKYWNTVYVLPVVDGRPGKWMDTVFSLPCPVAYGASLTTDRGIVCIGGRNDSGYLARAFLLQWSPERNTIDTMPLADLPIPLASLAAARINDAIYVAGGENKQGKHACFYRLDLGHPQTGWEILPALPGGALSDAVLAGQSDGDQVCIYLIGGRTATHDGITAFYNTVYKFDPRRNSWHQMRGIVGKDGLPVALAAGTGIALDDHDIVLVGGDDGKLFHILAAWKKKIAEENDPALRVYWQRRYDSLFLHHPGFNRDIFLYNTVRDTWTTLDRLPYPAPATTNIFRLGTKIIIPSGEVRPGIRTSGILEATIK